MNIINIILEVIRGIFAISLVVFFITVPFFMLKSCEEEREQKRIVDGTYTVTYEVVFPDSTRTFTQKTNQGKAQVNLRTRKYNNTVLYYLSDESIGKYLFESEYPIIIINQTKN